jgi:hypothetical protein
MKKKKYISILLIVIAIIVIRLFYYEKIYYEFEYPEKMPDNFNFIVEINHNDYILNTHKNEFTKGITWKKDTVLNYELSKVEKNRIYNLMKDINIIEYPNYYAPKTYLSITPSPVYYFKCEFDNIEIEINWKYNTESEQEKAVKLRDFIYSIFEKILEEKEIKNLPKSTRYRL